jgi:hypothetical protein
MSELLTTLRDSFPERYRTCPVLFAFLHQAELSEKAAAKHGETIDSLIRGQSVTPSTVDKAMIAVKGMYLDINTEVELGCTKVITPLTEGAEQCPGDTNTDELYIFPLSLNIIDSIKQDLVCQNPNLDKAIGEFQLR